MPNRIEELFAELAESAGEQQQFQIDQQLEQMEAQRQLHNTLAESVSGFGEELTQAGRMGREWQDIENERAVEGLYKDDAALLMGLATAATIPVSGPAWLSSYLARASSLVPKLASKVPGAEKLYGQVGQDFTKFIEPLKSKLSGVFGRSGSGVGADVVGRVPLPTAKPPVTTIRGPRGPTNIDSPQQIPLPLKGGRNTGGISATERAQLPQIGGGISATKTARGDKEFLDKIMSSVRRDITEEASKTNIKGVRFSRKEWDDMLDETAAEKLGLSLEKYRQKMNARIKLRRWKKGHEDKVRRGDAQYQEGWRSGYEPDIKGGGKMKNNSTKRIREIQAELDELDKLLG